MLRKIILPYGYGQTCNQLFQIAHWIPTAAELKVPLYFPGFSRYADLFSGTEKQQIPRYPRTAPAMGWCPTSLSRLISHVHARGSRVGIGPFFRLLEMLPGCVTFSWDDSGRDGSMNPIQVVSYRRVKSGRSLWVQGWLYRDRAGVNKHKLRILDFFAPIQDVRERVTSHIKEIRKGITVLVGVHLRRGDYRGGKFYFGDDVYRAMMQQMFAALPDRKIRFLLVSNEPIEKRNYAGLDSAIGLGDAAGDLFSLAACDYVIGPPSTFSLWASFFGNVPLYKVSEPAEALHLSAFTVCTG